jgi:biotin carboxyl carrier protein
VGDAVEEGQVVALIETMKLFNEVIVDFSGEVLEVTATEGDLVEVGHPLMFIRAFDREEEL